MLVVKKMNTHTHTHTAHTTRHTTKQQRHNNNKHKIIQKHNKNHTQQCKVINGMDQLDTRTKYRRIVAKTRTNQGIKSSFYPLNNTRAFDSTRNLPWDAVHKMGKSYS